MKIVFDGSATGFGPTGGTLSVFKSAETLARLGHKVRCLAETNNFTWVKLKHAKYTKIRSRSADVTIATGWMSVPHVLKSNSRVKIWWVRGWETWTAPKSKWIKLLKKFPNIVANSIGLASRIRKATGRDVPVIYPGVDNDDFYPVAEYRARDWRGVGALYNPSKVTKGMSLTKRILNRLNEMGYKTFMFGTKTPSTGYNCKFRKQPTIKQKRKLYNMCDVWIATSTSEGLHIPPIEAGMCGSVLVCTGAPYGGTLDYATHDKTAIVLGEKEHCNDYEEYVKAAELLLEDDDLRWDLSLKLQRKLKKRIGSRKRNMEAFVKHMKGLM